MAEPAEIPYPFITGLTRIQQYEIWQDFEALRKRRGGTRWATLVIAASDSTAANKATADYVCDAVGDQVQIQAAIDALKTRHRPGKIVLLEGTYYVTAPILIQLGVDREMVIEGSGGAGSAQNQANPTSRIEASFTSDNAVFECSGNHSSSVAFRNLAVHSLTHCIDAFSCRLLVEDCLLSAIGGARTASGIRMHSQTGGGEGSVIRGNVISVSTSNVNGGYGIDCIQGSQWRISDNYLSGLQVSNGAGIRIVADAGFQASGQITGNYVEGSGATAIYVDAAFTAADRVQIIGNSTVNFDYGVKLSGAHNCLVASNFIYQAQAHGIYLINFASSGAAYCYIVGNYVLDASTGTPGTYHGIRLEGSIGAVITNTTVTGNKIKGTNAAYAISLNSYCQDCGVFLNDWFGGYSVAALLDGGGNTRRESYFLDSALDLDANARVGVRKNSTGSTFKRRRLNLIEGTGVTLTVADDSGSEEVDITIAASAISAHETSHLAGGSDELIGDLNAIARVGVRKNSTGSTFQRRRLNLIEGSNITLTVADDSGSEEVDITIAASGGSGGTTVAEGSYWVASTSYAVGAVVTYGGTRFLCLTAHTSGATFDPTNWTPLSNMDIDNVFLWGTADAKDIEFDANNSASLPTGWGWVNQGSATYLERFSVGSMGYPTGQNTNSVRILSRSVPTASAYTMVAKMTLMSQPNGGNVYQGLILRDSATGKFAMFAIGTAGITLTYWTNATTFSSTPNSDGVVLADIGGPIYLRIKKNSSTSYDFATSYDGVTWRDMATGINITTHMTPDEYGFGQTTTGQKVMIVGMDWVRIR